MSDGAVRPWSNGLPWLPWLLAAVAFLAGYVLMTGEDASLRRAAGGAFGAALGGALLLWGVEEWGQGRIRGKRATVRREDAPLAFFVSLAAMRLVPGATLVLAGLWYLLRGG